MIIDRALLIPGRQTPVLFQPIDQPLYALAEAVNGPITGTGVVFMLFPRDGETKTVAAQVLPKLATPVSFVPSQTTRPTFGASAPAPFPSPAFHQHFTGDGFVPWARGEGQRHQLAPAFRTDMDLRTAAALTAPERVRLRALCMGPSRVLVRADDGAIHGVDIPVQLRCGVGLSLDRSKEASPEARLAPAIEAAGESGPAAIPLREVTPRGTGTDDPQHAVQDASVVSGGAASVRFLRRKQGLEPLPLGIGEVMSVHSVNDTTQT
jgi:hypothetical protein